METQTLEELESTLKVLLKEYEGMFTAESIREVAELNNRDYHSLTEAERRIRMTHAPHVKQIRKLTNKIDIIKLGASKKTLRKRRQKANSWARKMADAPEKLQRLRDRLDKRLFAIDTEYHEFSKKLLEVGISIYEKGKISTFHYIVSENYSKRNRRYVPDNKDNFNFGPSLILPLESIKAEVARHHVGTDYNVGHSFGSDKEFLVSCGRSVGDNVLDTTTYARFYFQEPLDMSLEKLAIRCGFEPTNLHNAGNDAHYTMLCLLEMAKEK